MHHLVLTMTLVALLVPGCFAARPTPFAPELVPCDNVEPSAHFLVLTNQSALDHFWTASCTTPKPSVDFGSSMVVVRFLGMEPSSGFASHLTAVTRQGEAAAMEYDVHSPGATCPTLGVITYPEVVAVVDQASGRSTTTTAASSTNAPERLLPAFFSRHRIPPSMLPATIVIDGECGLCKRAASYGMGKGRPGMLKFVAQQDTEGLELLDHFALQDTAKESMVAVVGDRAFVRSAAVVQVAKRLRGWRRLQAGVWLVPKPLRDAGYRFVARRRHDFT